MDKSPDLAALWREIGSQLEKKKREINEEILNYPPPIPACDAQFNHLLDERARITQELNRLRDVLGQDTSTEALITFIGACPYVDDTLAETVG